MGRPKSKNTGAALAERFAAVQRFYRAGENDHAIDSAVRLLADLPAEGFEAMRDDAVLLALFASARQRNFEGGWQLVERYGEVAARHLDFCYAACYLAFGRADYEATELWGHRYLEMQEAGAQQGRHSATHDKRHEVLNTLGCAAKDRGNDAAALKYLSAASDAAPDYALPYLNLAQVARRAGDAEAARRHIEQGLAACGEVEELRMFERAVLSGPRISLCMIVRDEEEMLPKALESVQGTVDEIVVVDTGSTDRTVEIAESFGARVYRHAWQNDFSAARNLSIGYATGDWVLILDADERLHPDTAHLVRKLAADAVQEAISFSVYNTDLDNDHISFLPSVRMFKGGRGYGYTGIVHNQINLPPDCPVLRAPVRIDHYGYTPSIAEARGKFKRTTALLEQQLRENPDDAFAHFNMAQIMRGGPTATSHAPRIIEHARRVTELIAPEEHQHRHILLMAYHQLASSHFLLEEYEAAERACREALRIKPDFIDCLLTLGHTLSIRKHFDLARETFLSYLRARKAYRESEETAGFILLSLETQHQAHYGLGLIEEAKGELALALEWYEKVAEAKEDYLETHLRMGQIAYRIGRLEQAQQSFLAELRSRPESFWAHFCMGDLGAKTERWVDAYTHYQAAHAVRPDHPNLPLNLATVALKLGRAEDAVRWLTLVRPELAHSAPVLRTKGEVALAAGDWKTAGIHLADYLKLEPEDASAWLSLGNAHFKCGEMRQAESCYRKSLSADPALHHARRNMALIALQEKRYDAALEALLAYLQPDVEDPDATIMLADLLASRGDHARALVYFERYLGQRPHDHAAIFRLANSYHAMGQQDAAIMGYRHLLTRDPDYGPAKAALEALQSP